MDEWEKSMAARLWKTKCDLALMGQLSPGTKEDANESARWLKGEGARDSGRAGCSKAPRTKNERQQTPLQLAGVFFRQPCVICVTGAVLPTV